MKNLLKKGASLLTAIAIFFGVMAISFGIYIIDDGGAGVSGSDAFMLVSNHARYWSFIAGALVAAALIIYLAVRFDFYNGWLFLVVAVMVACSIFIMPIKFKIDPVSSGATTEEINYLKTKGLK
jgi:hypothetical protein